MTLLILSDTHGRPDRITEIIRRTRPDGILFAGDGLRDLTHCEIPCPLWAVKGNCDWGLTPLVVGNTLLEAEDETILTLEGIRILLCHGHRYGVKSGLSSLTYRAEEASADVVVFGHTHLPLELRLTPERDSSLSVTRPLTLFNPGSLGDRSASFGTLTIRGGQCLFGHGEL